MANTRIGMLGTGVVGQTLTRRLVEVGYDVMVGARSRDSDSLNAFSDLDTIATGAFEDAAAFGDLVINATNGSNSLEALEQAGADNLADKPLLDVSNDLEPVEGGYPRPRASADNSLGQRIQQAFPAVKVVKSLNTMNCQVMVDPSIVPGDHVAFLSGDDSDAKAAVTAVLIDMGWRPEQLVDLGGIDSAAATEMMMSLWMRVRIGRGMDAPPFNWAINSG